MNNKHQPCGKPGCLNCWPSTAGLLPGQSPPHNPQIDLYRHLSGKRYVVKVDPVPSKKLLEQLEGYGGRKIEWIIFDEADDMPHEEPKPSIPKLIAKLAFRIALVIGAAIVALAVFS